MNPQRRKLIAEIASLVEQASGATGEVLEQETEAMDKTPESLQGTANYERSEAAVEILQEVIEALDEAAEKLGSIE